MLHPVLPGGMLYRLEYLGLSALLQIRCRISRVCNIPETGLHILISTDWTLERISDDAALNLYDLRQMASGAGAKTNIQ